MTKQEEQVQAIELTDELITPGAVSFDSVKASLEGSYRDELSLHRAKKIWIDTLETNFLLEKGHDFKIKITRNIAEEQFSMSCDFTTACGRYALWRLTHDQAPEAQYLIETAHIPQCESRLQEILFAPDLKSKRENYHTGLYELESAIADNAVAASLLHKVSRKILDILLVKKK